MPNYTTEQPQEKHFDDAFIRKERDKEARLKQIQSNRENAEMLLDLTLVGDIKDLYTGVSDLYKGQVAGLLPFALLFVPNAVEKLGKVAKKYFDDVYPYYYRYRTSKPYTKENVPGLNRTKLIEGKDVTSLDHTDVSSDGYYKLINQEWNNVKHGQGFGFQNIGSTSTSSYPMFLNVLERGYGKGTIGKVFNPNNGGRTTHYLNSSGRQFYRDSNGRIRQIVNGDEGVPISNQEYVDWLNGKIENLNIVTGSNLPPAKVIKFKNGNERIEVPNVAGFKL